MNVRQLLSSPFILQVNCHELVDGSWETVVGYPELGVTVKGTSIVDMMEEVEIARVRSLTAMIEKGSIPEARRPPLADLEVDQLLISAGLEAWLDRLDEIVA